MWGWLFINNNEVILDLGSSLLNFILFIFDFHKG